MRNITIESKRSYEKCNKMVACILSTMICVACILINSTNVFASSVEALFPAKNISINEGDIYEMDLKDAVVTSSNDNVATVIVR